jgi:hypothetical protein
MLLRMGGLTGNKADIAASADELDDGFTRPYVEAISPAVPLPCPTCSG